MAHKPLHDHLRAKGAMTRKNPELLRLAKATGYSVEHLYHVAVGRPASLPCAKAIVRAVHNPAVTVDSLLAEAVPA